MPKSICEELGWKIGDKIEVALAHNGMGVELRAPKNRFSRTKVLTIDELFDGYEGGYEVPADLPSSGLEIDWGEPVGSELW